MATAILVCVASCSEYEAGYEEELSMAKTIHTYTENFENRYGKIDPNHTWGFGSVGGELETRGVDAKAESYQLISLESTGDEHILNGWAYGQTYIDFRSLAPQKTDRDEFVSQEEYNKVMNYLKDHPNEGGRFFLLMLITLHNSSVRVVVIWII